MVISSNLSHRHAVLATQYCEYLTIKIS